MRELILTLALGAASPAIAQTAGPMPGAETGIAISAADAARYPLFSAEVERTRGEVEAAIRAGVNVPVPKDPGGGFTHEQHKRNYRAIYGAGLLYRITGEARYAEHVRQLLLAYAKLYPTLGPHPAKANQTAGRLFWQSLNDSVFLVHALQGYEAARATLSESDRRAIEDGALRPMARFLSEGSPESFDRIHNHATWACAAVGMTGYALGDRDLVDKALLGLDKRGNTGFLRQLDLLFSPDGYYAEGPYYQRYALQPFVMFAAAIEANDPKRGIFRYRDGIVLKAVNTAIQMTYKGHFFPLNDAMPDKSLRTEELYHGVAVAYAATRNPGLLSIAKWQGRTVLTPAGMMVARDLAEGNAAPFGFRSELLSDGPDGKDGALAVLRSGRGENGFALVAKNTAQGMGHGHFDKLNWLLYDNGNAIVTDYGAARFLNIEAKAGGRYLPENDSWAQQTIAHNTLVVDETSHFEAKERVGEKVAPVQLAFNGQGLVQWSIASVTGAYPDVRFRRALVTVDVEGLAAPLVLDLVHATGTMPHRYDLPLHYDGHLIDTDLVLASNPSERRVLGKANGYQHVWVDATGRTAGGTARTTWMTGNRFYTYRMVLPTGGQVILAESGANDPRFNLRREPMIVQRIDATNDASFVSLLEPHGTYDPSVETVSGSTSRIASLAHERVGAVSLVTITLIDRRKIYLAVADDGAAKAAHTITVNGKKRNWTGPVARFTNEETR